MTTGRINQVAPRAAAAASRAGPGGRSGRVPATSRGSRRARRCPSWVSITFAWAPAPASRTAPPFSPARGPRPGHSRAVGKDACPIAPPSSSAACAGLLSLQSRRTVASPPRGGVGSCRRFGVARGLGWTPCRPPPGRRLGALRFLRRQPVLSGVLWGPGSTPPEIGSMGPKSPARPSARAL